MGSTKLIGQLHWSLFIVYLFYLISFFVLFTCLLVYRTQLAEAYADLSSI